MRGKDVAKDVEGGDLEGGMAFGETMDEEGEIFFRKGLREDMLRHAIRQKEGGDELYREGSIDLDRGAHVLEWVLHGS